MQFNCKIYKIKKLKKCLNKNNLLFLFDSVKLNKKKWTFSEQNLKKFKLKYYKPSNKITIKLLKDSIYKNFNYNIIGFVFFINFYKKRIELKLFSVIKSLRPSFILISIKLNNKIYSLAQIKRLEGLSYNKNVFNLVKIFSKQLMITSILTNLKKTSKQCDSNT